MAKVTKKSLRDTERAEAITALREMLPRICDALIAHLAVRGIGEITDSGKLRDVNGNTVGTWTYTPEEG